MQPSFSTSSDDKFRGAVVEDLQLPPAFALYSTERVSRATELAYERDFSYIPVLNKNRRPLGYIDVANLKKKWETHQANLDDRISKFMVKFVRKASEPYTLITPETNLEVLEKFLNSSIFALVTDNDRKFVLGVATSQDLDNFVTRRGL